MIFYANSSPFKLPVISHYMHVLKLIYAHSDVLSFKIRSKLEIYVRSAGHEATVCSGIRFWDNNGYFLHWYFVSLIIFITGQFELQYSFISRNKWVKLLVSDIQTPNHTHNINHGECLISKKIRWEKEKGRKGKEKQGVQLKVRSWHNSLAWNPNS